MVLGVSTKSAACDKLTRWTKFSSSYESLKTEFLNGPLSITQIDQQIDLWVKQIRSAHTEASNLHEDVQNEESWINEINLFKAQLSKARQN